MRAYDLQSWAGFLTAVVGAGAGLAGLIFVALSINLDRLAARPKLAARAAETLAVLLLAVIGSALSLMPMDRVDVGIVLLAVATPVWVVTLKQQLRQGPDSPDHPHWWFLSRIAVTQCAELPIMALHRTWSTVPDSHSQRRRSTPGSGVRRARQQCALRHRVGRGRWRQRQASPPRSPRAPVTPPGGRGGSGSGRRLTWPTRLSSAGTG